MKVPKLFALVTFILACSWNLGAQTEWQKIAPVEESFTVLMPTQALAVSRVIPLHDNSVPGRVYYSLHNKRRYLIVSFARTTPEQMISLSNFGEFVRAMEQSFVTKDGENRSLTFDQDLSDKSGIVKRYHLQIGEYKGVARFMGNDKNFYAQMVIGADESDPDVRRFFSSFQTVPASETRDGKNIVAISEGFVVNPDFPPEPWPKAAGPIIGGVLNGKAITLARPGYPKEARKHHEEGMVKVRIIIDESGNVISAQAIEGPESLRAASVDAASRSRFTPTRLMGQPVKVSGIIIYNFVAQ